MAAEAHAQRLLPRRDIGREDGAGRVPRGAGAGEVVLDHPLQERFGDHHRLVPYAEQPRGLVAVGELVAELRPSWLLGCGAALVITTVCDAPLAALVWLTAIFTRLATLEHVDRLPSTPSDASVIDANGDDR